MSKIAIRLLILSIYATTLMVGPVVTLAQAETSSSKHSKKHRETIQRSPGIRDSLYAGQAWRGVLPALSFRQARSAQASPEASIAGYGLLQSMRILIENAAAGAGDGARGG
jgi:hypothetical protein